MAKSKSKTRTKPEPIEEEEIVEEADAEEVADDFDADEPIDDDEPIADQEPEIEADADEPEVEADADEPEVEADADEPEIEADADEPEADDEAAFAGPPPPKISKTTLVLILLNWIAAPAFLYVAYNDHVARSQYSYRALVNYVQVWGLPLRSEEEFPSVSNYTRPVQKFSAEQLKDAFNKRPGVTRVSEPFQPVEEEVPLRLFVKDMTEAVQKDVFWDLSNPVATLEDEIDRLKIDLPNKVNAAAKDVVDSFAKMKDEDKRAFIQKNLVMPGDAAQVKKMEDQIANVNGAELDDLVKRAAVQKTLFPLAWNVWQVKKLDDQLNAAKGADLDKLVMESVQRRIYYDILAPLNVFRPADVGVQPEDRRKFQVERIADQAFKIEAIEEHLQKLLSAANADQYDSDLHIGEHWKKEQPADLKRDSIEKRRVIGFILFTLGQVQKPTLGKKLIDKGVERAQVVSGLYEFTSASISYVRTQRILEQRIAASVSADRQGWIVTLQDKTLSRTPGSIDEFEAEVDRLIKIVEQIDTAEKRLADIKGQRDHFQKIHEQRAQQHKDALTQLFKARRNTDKYVKDLRELQDRLIESLLELSDASERNFQIEAEIRAIELNYMKQTQRKGGKKP